MPAIVSKMSLTLNSALAAGPSAITSVAIRPWSAGILRWARNAGSTGETETPIQNSGGAGCTGPNVTFDLGLDLERLLLALMQQDQTERLVPGRLEMLLQVLRLAQGRLAQGQEDVVLADARPRRPLGATEVAIRPCPLGSFRWARAASSTGARIKPEL